MPAVFESGSRSGLSPNWHSGLKTLPSSRLNSTLGPQKANPNVYKHGPPENRWDVENVKVVEHDPCIPPTRRTYVHDGEWSSGIKTIERDGRGAFDPTLFTECGLMSPKVYGSPSAQIKEVANRCNHGDVEDWEYSSTMHKTLEVDIPKPGHESWFTENLKVLPENEALSRPPYRPSSPYASPHKLLETETRPTTIWSAGEKVVPRKPRRTFQANKPCDIGADTVQRPGHLPSDGTWASESFKVVNGQGDLRKPRRVPGDDWEGGYKVLDDRKVKPPKIIRQTWNEENRRTFPPEHLRKPNPYRFVIENTGWDSGHFKTFEADELAPSKYAPARRIPYALHNDFYLDNKTLPDIEQHPHRHGYGPHHHVPFVFAGSGWDSGIKAFPRAEAQVASPARFRTQAISGRAGDDPQSWGFWDLESRKTLPWEVSHSATSLGESNKHIAMARAGDMDRLNRRMGGYQSGQRQRY